jgi:enoyl-CoA hydratase/carnithine racemase
MLDVEHRSGVTVLRLRNGKVNALDLELLRAITAALAKVDERAAVVITGTGTAFSAGVDLHRVVAGGPSYLQEFLPALTAAFLAIFDHPGPVLAAINGHAIAGGCVIAAACDVRVMSQGTIGLAELSVGVPFPVAALEIMRHAAGTAASRLVLAAELLGPAQAQAIGLIDGVEEPGALLPSVIGQAQRMAQIPAGVFAVSKRQLQQPARDRIAARRGEDAEVLATWSSAATQAAITGYLGTLKRRPR